MKIGNNKNSENQTFSELEYIDKPIYDAIDIIGSDYLTKDDKIDIINTCLIKDELQLFLSNDCICLSVENDLLSTSLSAYSPSIFKVSEDGGKTFNTTKEFFFININEEDYNYLVKSEKVLSNAIYEVYSENENFYDE